MRLLDDDGSPRRPPLPPGARRVKTHEERGMCSGCGGKIIIEGDRRSCLCGSYLLSRPTIPYTPPAPRALAPHEVAEAILRGDYDALVEERTRLKHADEQSVAREREERLERIEKSRDRRLTRKEVA